MKRGNDKLHTVERYDRPAKKIEVLITNTKKLHQRPAVGFADGNFCSANIYIILFKRINPVNVDGIAALYTGTHG